jgi:NAD-dependent deacetylase
LAASVRAADAGGPAPRLPETLRERLAGVRSVGVVTGAGISRAAGLRTYRGEGGVYEDPAEGSRTIEALSGPTLRRNPERTWEAVLRLARKAHRAEPGSRNVIEIHGNVFRTRCEGCGDVGALPETALPPGAPRPPCAACGETLRPDVVLFGEALPLPELQRLHEGLRLRSPDLVLLVGTSALFPYIVEPALLARRRGKVTVEVNPEPTEASGAVDHALRGTAEEWLPALVRALPPPLSGG